jgi:spore maturation protein SpmA
VIGIRSALGSGNPADIVLPTLLATLLSTGIGIALTFLLLRDKKALPMSKNKKKHRGQG